MNSSVQAPTQPEDAGRALAINEALAGTGLYTEPQRAVADDQATSWRISPSLFALPSETWQLIEGLGEHLLAFYRAANRLYQWASRGRLPDWVREYLEIGKSETALDYGRMRRFRTDLPIVIRPDLLALEDGGHAIAELDSVPGGMGSLAAMSDAYSKLGESPVGGADGMPERFAQGLRALVPDREDPVIAIAVSDESDAYRSEMTWLAAALRERGTRAYTVHPRQFEFTEDGLFLPADVAGERTRIDVLYRFFELFDLKNIPKIDLILYSIRKELVVATPPLKHQLEEKSLFALFHHPVLRPFWEEALDEASLVQLRSLIPKSWVLDPRPLPPHAVVPGIDIGGVPVVNWNDLKQATQKERELVVKPSGFSADAWGSRGVAIGHDLSAEDWAAAVDRALDSFSHNPHVLQAFHKSRRFDSVYHDFDTGRSRRMDGRARLCPYYFVVADEVRLGGVMATVAPPDKKAIHGMVDAVMVPCKRPE